MDKSSAKPKIEVTLENGKTNLFTKKLKYENTAPLKLIKFHDQAEIRSDDKLIGW